MRTNPRAILESLFHRLQAIQAVQQLKASCAHLRRAWDTLFDVPDCELDPIYRHARLVRHFEIDWRWSFARFGTCYALSHRLGLHNIIGLAPWSLRVPTSFGWVGFRLNLQMMQLPLPGHADRVRDSSSGLHSRH